MLRGNLGVVSQKIHEEYLAVSGSVCVQLRSGKEKRPTLNPNLNMVIKGKNEYSQVLGCNCCRLT
jgi:hypothetical protein